MVSDLGDRLLEGDGGCFVGKLFGDLGLNAISLEEGLSEGLGEFLEGEDQGAAEGEGEDKGEEGRMRAEGEDEGLGERADEIYEEGVGDEEKEFFAAVKDEGGHGMLLTRSQRVGPVLKTIPMPKGSMA